MRIAAAVLSLALAGCTQLGLTPPDPAVDCDAQSALLTRATADVKKLSQIERAAIDADLALSDSYCSGAVGADVAAASQAIQTANAHIAAVLAIAELR